MYIYMYVDMYTYELCYSAYIHIYIYIGHESAARPYSVIEAPMVRSRFRSLLCLALGFGLTV